MLKTIVTENWMVSTASYKRYIEPEKIIWKWNWFVVRLELWARTRTRRRLDDSVGKDIFCKP